MDKNICILRLPVSGIRCSSRVTSFPTTASCRNDRIVNGLRTIPSTIIIVSNIRKINNYTINVYINNIN